MKNITTFGAILFITGFILLVYQGFSFTKRETVLDLGPIKATADRTETVPVPPIIGWVVTATGAVLLLKGLTKSNA